MLDPRALRLELLRLAIGLHPDDGAKALELAEDMAAYVFDFEAECGCDTCVAARLKDGGKLN